MRNVLYKSIAVLSLMLALGLTNSLYAQKYCYPSLSSGCSGDSIAYFSFGAYSRYPTCISGGIDTTQTKTSVMTLYRGKNYTTDVNSNTSNYFGVYIDFNANGSFDDPGEWVGNDINGTFSAY